MHFLDISTQLKPLYDELQSSILHHKVFFLCEWKTVKTQINPLKFALCVKASSLQSLRSWCVNTLRFSSNL